MEITLNITDPEGNLLGQVKISRKELKAARESTVGSQAVVSDICTEAGIR